MTKISFKSAARALKAEFAVNFSHKWQIAVAVLEMAHAIKRGRSPSTSMVTNQNIRAWWYDLLWYDEGATDYEGHKTSIVWGLYDTANDCCDDPVFLAIREAISLCKTHFEKVGRPKLFSKSYRRILKRENRSGSYWNEVHYNDLHR